MKEKLCTPLLALTALALFYGYYEGWYIEPQAKIVLVFAAVINLAVLIREYWPLRR